MDTIALWEEEIIESNKYHFFEETANILDYLMESIEIDYQLLEMGIITEAEEGEEEPNDNTEDTKATEDNKEEKKEDSQINLKVTEKIKMFIGRIIMSIDELILKVRKFITDKINDLKQKHIIEKFKKGKIDKEKVVEKLNKTNIFDPEKLYKILVHEGIFGEYFGSIFGVPMTAPTFTENETIDKFNAQVQRLNSLSTLKDHNHAIVNSNKEPIKADIKINPTTAQFQIADLYNNTLKYAEKINEKSESFKEDVEKKKKQISEIKDKQDLKSAKGLLAIFKSYYIGTQRVYKMFIQQAKTLEAIMIGELASGSSENGEEKKEEENK